MNIHFKNKELFNDLNENTVLKCKVGSHLYGLNDENSDNDFLSIYLENDRSSFLWEHHQLQFKEDKIDYNFSSLQMFIRNTLTGDATINFEVLWSEEIKDSELSWLTDFKHDFVNYNIIKSYLGLAKRDLKYWRKETSNASKFNASSNKKLSHFVRGLIFAKMLLEDNFTLDLENRKTFDNGFKNDKDFLIAIKKGDYFGVKLLAQTLETTMNEMRTELNSRLEKREIRTYMNTTKLELLDITMKKFIKSKKDLSELDYGNIFYDVLENGISY